MQNKKLSQFLLHFVFEENKCSSCCLNGSWDFHYNDLTVDLLLIGGKLPIRVWGEVSLQVSQTCKALSNCKEFFQQNKNI